MSALGKDFAFVTQHIRNLRGGSQAILAQASDGLIYVVKFTNNLQGANLPFNESAGSELYRACGLAGPSWKQLMVTDAFIDQNPDCWMQTPEGFLRPESGLCFGSRFLGGDNIRLFEILPGASFKRVRNPESFWLAWLIDICACHADNRQAIFLKSDEGWLDAFFVDHGHLFGGPTGELRPHFLASRYLDQRIYQRISSHQLVNFQTVVQRLDVDELWRRIESLPDEWKLQSAVGGFAQCLCRLSTSNLLQNILDAMVDALQDAEESEYGKHQTRPKPPESILCSGVSASRLDSCFVPKGYNCAACA
jgi:hypothetical protein